MQLINSPLIIAYSMAVLMAVLMAVTWPEKSVLAEAPIRPNIIVVFTDDQTFRAIGYENPEVKTPQLDALSSAGIRFRNCYVASPICAASRASMMTGQFPQQHGVTALHTQGFAPYCNDRDKSRQSLAHCVAAAGYHTAFFGKSHLGDPKSYGFEIGSELPGADDVETFRQATAFIESQVDEKKPFFLWLAPRQPHVPLFPEKRWRDLYPEGSIRLPGNFRVAPTDASLNNQGTPSERMFRDSNYRNNHGELSAGPPRDENTMLGFTRIHHAVVSRLDDQVARFAGRLEEIGLMENTIVFYLSDNGYHLGSHGLGNKITMHEESVRVPCFAFGARVPRGVESRALVSSLDIYPTVLELAAADAPPKPPMGKSLLQLFGDQDAPHREFVFSECVGVQGKKGEGHRMARSPRWKLILSDTDEEFFFDQQKDPLELENRIADPELAGEIETLRAALASWMTEIDDRSYPEKPPTNKATMDKSSADKSNTNESNSDELGLPDPLQPSGEKAAVTSAAEWESRGRPTTLKLFEQHMYGETPRGPWELEFKLLDERKDAFDGLATRRLVRITLKDLPAWSGLELLLYVPNERPQGPVPAFVGLSFRGNHAVTIEPDVPLSTRWQSPDNSKGIVNHRATEASRGSASSRWPLKTVLQRGYAVATAYCGDVEPDHADGWRDGLRGALRKRDGEKGEMAEGEWACLGAWAWSLSRIVDYLETVPEVDASRSISIGHSRLGKASLWAGAQDKRFALVISNNSGEGGAALKYRNFGETPKQITSRFPHWFTKTYLRYTDDPRTCPVDQHQLIALIAPRAAYVASASKDMWADPKGEFLAAKHSGPVYRLYGMESVGLAEQPPLDQSIGGRVGYHVRSGSHDITPFDWERYLDFADKQFKPDEK